METIKFYTNPMSRGRVVHWMLEEVGAKYEVELLNFEKREHKDKKFLEINPLGKVPAIVHRGVNITESRAIVAYLADIFPKANLAPAVGTPERGAYYRWLFFSVATVEPAIVDKMLNRPLVERPGVLAYGNYADTFDALENIISRNDFLIGDHFTAVDLSVASQIGWGMFVKVLEERPAFKRYVARCTDRPAFQRTIKQSEEWTAKLGGKA